MNPLPGKEKTKTGGKASQLITIAPHPPPPPFLRSLLHHGSQGSWYSDTLLTHLGNSLKVTELHGPSGTCNQSNCHLKLWLISQKILLRTRASSYPRHTKTDGK